MSLTRPRIQIALFAALMIAGCAVPPPLQQQQQQQQAQQQLQPAGTVAAGGHIEVAFSPEAGAEALVLKVINSAQQQLRLAGYTFTSPAVVRALVEAYGRNVDVQMLVDDKGNHGRSSLIAMKLIADAGIPIRTISAYAIHHDKYIVVDGRTTETGSFNYSQAAARSNSENVMVVWNDPAVAAAYLAHWQGRWSQGIERKE